MTPHAHEGTAADAAEIVCSKRLLSGDGFQHVLVVDHDPESTSDVFQAFTPGRHVFQAVTSDVFQAFVKSKGSCLIVGSAYHKKTKAKVDRANGVIGDTLRAFTNGWKDDWDRQLALVVIVINMEGAVFLC